MKPEDQAALEPGTVIKNVPQQPGMPMGLVGLAGENQPGPSVAINAVPAWKYYGAKALSPFLTVFFVLLGFDASGFIEIARQDDAWAHIWKTLIMAAAPTVLILGWELKLASDKIVAERRQ